MPRETPSVVVLGSWPPDPGISSYVVQFTRALADRIPVTVLTFSSMYPDWLYPKGPVPRDHTFPQLDHPRLNVRRRLAWYNPFGWMGQGFAITGDVLHVQFWSLPLAPVLWVVMLLARFRGKKIVLTAHNLAGHERTFAYALATRLLLGLSHRVIVHNEKVPDDFKAKCRRYCGHDPVVISHGVLDLYPPSGRPIAEIPQAARVILFFGAIRPYKGLDVLLDAFDQRARFDESLWLVIAGRPWESFDRYQAMIDRCPAKDRIVCRLEYIPTGEVASYFERSDVVVLPYRTFDAQSGVGLSAAGFGKPTIVTDAGPLPELQPDARYVVRAGDASALAESLERAFETPGELARLTEIARGVARSHSWDEIADRTLGVYETLIRQHGSSKGTADGP